jgi:hypothetical protein
MPPFRPQPSSDNPEESIKMSWPGSWLSSPQDHELLAQSEVLQQEVASRAEETRDQLEEEPKHDGLYIRRLSG